MDEKQAADLRALEADLEAEAQDWLASLAEHDWEVSETGEVTW